MCSVQVPVFELGTGVKPAEIAKRGLEKARQEDFDAVIVDTAGRLQASSLTFCSTSAAALICLAECVNTREPDRTCAAISHNKLKTLSAVEWKA